ncbi:hypothetical protein UFOVP965_133 [uncultured Caudovirales phage]|uniref:Uncharacterized protein n=1 Tax=uncultured Caudovirales phage TaxID=2100421 RepID=A0A6J5PVN0_9CAUD|nr:hypothetical protein UFOVP965_133 [uncultured Caudovirales phage]CAB4179922.1 hypothetical protein UFOVP1035_129 [uncultured Caudovirales phage]CAB4188766.1 hypothetical protein UFOVP1181_88 [uncultured Caudovirales phage]
MSVSDWVAVTALVTSQIGAIVMLAIRIEKRFNKIEYQLYENGGSSLKDQMNDTRDDLVELKTSLAVFKAKLGFDPA